MALVTILMKFNDLILLGMNLLTDLRGIKLARSDEAPFNSKTVRLLIP